MNDRQEYESGLNVASTNIGQWIFTWGISKTKRLVQTEIAKHQTICAYNRGIIEYYNNFLERQS